MQRVFVFVDRARVVLLVFFGSRKARMSCLAAAPVSPSLVRLTRGDIESVSVRRRENFEIAASKTPFNVTS